MKKMIAAIIIIVMNMCLVQNVMAQDKDKKMMHDGVVMKDGKMWMKKDGERSEMTAEMTLNDGTKVMPNGSVTMPDGTARMLKDGEMITMDG